VYYAIYRMPGRVEGVACTDDPGATRCFMEMPRVAMTRDTTYSERRPKGGFTYRVAALANPLNSALFGSDVIFVSAPVTVRTP